MASQRCGVADDAVNTLEPTMRIDEQTGTVTHSIQIALLSI